MAYRRRSCRETVQSATFGLANRVAREQYLDVGSIKAAIAHLKQNGDLAGSRKKKDKDHAACLRSLIDLARAMVGGQASRAKVVFSQNGDQLRLAFNTGTRVHGDPDFRWGSDDSTYTGRHWCGVVFAINLDT